MAGDPKHPEENELIIDGSDLASFLVDIAPGGLVGLLPEQEGVKGVLGEIFANQATLGDKAGITNGDFADLQLTEQRITHVRSFLPALRKLLEIFEETEATLVDKRERKIKAIALSVDGRSKLPGGDELLAKYDKTRVYRSAIGVKAAKARKKNAAAEAEAEAGDASDGTGGEGGAPPA